MVRKKNCCLVNMSPLLCSIAALPKLTMVFPATTIMLRCSILFALPRHQAATATAILPHGSSKISSSYQQRTKALPGNNAAGSRSAVRSSSNDAVADADASSSSIDYHNLLPENITRRSDLLVGLEAVRKACIVTKALQPDHPTEFEKRDDDLSIMKEDFSPVTVADFAAQAIVLSRLHQAFPEDGFIAEESSQSLRRDNALASRVLLATREATWAFDDLFSSIDLGKMYENSKLIRNKARIWTCDPIDGTRGFLRGRLHNGQYCVALALIEDGVPIIGILGCPNLVATEDDNWDDMEETRGCIFAATLGGGCYQLPISSDDTEHIYCHKVHVSANDGIELKVSDARFCLGKLTCEDMLLFSIVT